MKGRLLVRYEKWLEGDEVNRGVLANVYGVDTGAEDLRNVLIPAGERRLRVLDVKPGRYLVQCALPTGEVVSEEVDVGADDDVTVSLRSEESPHEWLSWHQFTGHVRARAAYERQPLVAHPFEPTARLVKDKPAGAAEWTRDIDAFAWTPGYQAVLPHNYDDQVLLYRFTDQDRPPYRDEPLAARQYLVVKTEGATELISLPVPWIDIERGIPALVEVLVRRQAPAGQGAVSITVRDTTLGSALAYMTTGALPSAARVIEDAEPMLFMKLTNPLGAAAGGYVLLGTEQGTDKKRWHPWIHNLNKWFPWLPDGAIQEASLTLRHRRSVGDVQRAKRRFRDAYERGLPFFSAGLRWLADGLTLFAEEDPEFERMLLDVTRISRRANPAEPFTILRYRDVQNS